MLVTTLDDIAWLLNLRGRDKITVPVFLSYLIIKKDKDGQITCELFTDPSKVTDVKPYLDSINVTVHPYETITNYLTTLK